MRAPIGIGVLGCGAVAKAHAEAITRVPELRRVSTCSRTVESAERLAGEYGVRAYTDLEEFFNAPNLDAVTICTPSGTHAELGAAAALVGKHMVVEKPIDVSLERADALIEACDRADRRLAVSLQSRYLDAPRALKSAVESGRLGRLVM